MKKPTNLYFCLLLCSLINLAGCSSNSDPLNDQPVEPKEQVEPQKEINPMDAFTPSVSNPILTQKNLLGCGYDISDYYASNFGVRSQIIDIEKFINENKYGYTYNGSTYGFSYSVKSCNGRDYAKELTYTVKESLDSDIDGLSPETAAFSSTILSNKPFFRGQDKLPSNYAYASGHIYAVTKSHWFSIYDLNRLFLYVNESFITDTKTLTATELVKKYGTHILTKYSEGIRLDFIYQSKIELISEIPGSTKIDPSKVVLEGLRSTLKKMGIFINGSLENSEHLNELNNVPILFIAAIGADASLIPSGTYNLQKGYPEIDYERWSNSRLEDNLSLISFELKKLIPIYEFISDHKIRSQVRVEVNRHIESKSKLLPSN